MILSVNPIKSVLCVVDVSEKIAASFFTVTKKSVRNISVESEVVGSTLLEKLIIFFIISAHRDLLKTVQRICSQGWRRELLDQSEVSQTTIRILEMYFFLLYLSQTVLSIILVIQRKTVERRGIL